MKKFRSLPVCFTICLGALIFLGVFAFHSAGGNNVPVADEAALEIIGGGRNPICMRPPPVELASLGATERSLFSSPAGPAPADVVIPARNVAPLRTIWDPGPNFSGVFVDTVNDEIIAIDNGHNQVFAYARTANGLTPPLRLIKGLNAQIDFPASVYVNTKRDEIYVVDNEITDHVNVHSRTATGDPKPLRRINLRLPTADRRYYDGVQHPFGIWADPEANELVSTTQLGNNIATWDLDAGESGIPKRNIQGKNTRLADPRGVSIDKAHNEIVVVTDGHLAGAEVPPAILFFKRDADGDVPPLRRIEGPLTKLDYAAKGLYLDTVNDEIYIAVSNDAILVFPRTATGNVAPSRILRGALTGLDHPTGVFVDTIHNEMVVSNWENFSITVYPRTANGNVAPIRTIRASGNKKSIGLLRGRAMASDRVNDEIWHMN